MSRNTGRVPIVARFSPIETLLTTATNLAPTRSKSVRNAIGVWPIALVHQLLTTPKNPINPNLQLFLIMPVSTRAKFSSEPMTDGLHAVQIVHVDSKISQTGNEYLRCRLEDLFTKERCSFNVVFSDRSAPYVDRFAEAIGGILPPVGTGYLLEPKHCRGRILFVLTKAETSEDFCEQIRVTKLLSP